MKLNTRQIERAKPTAKVQRFSDGLGLYLAIDAVYQGKRGEAGGTKRFLWRGTLGGAVTELSLGKWPVVTLDDARNQTIEIHRAIRDGIDPRTQRRGKRAKKAVLPTLAHCIREAFAVRAESVKQGRGLVARQKFLETHAVDLLNRAVDTITPAEIVETLRPQWHRQSGRSMRNDLRGAFDWAVASNMIPPGANPAGDCIAAMLPKGGIKVENRAAIDYKQMPDILRKVESAGVEAVYRLCWRFMALAACRPSEALGAHWNEIEGDTWVIPADRMKSGREHAVPLCGQAVAVLEKARELGSGGFIFKSPNDSSKAMSVHGLHKVREAVGIRATMSNHGARSVFRSWAADCTDFAPDVVELSLAHTVGNSVERSYNRAQLLEKRRALHNAYCEFLTSNN